MLSDYDIVIGLEIHAELNTNTKVFCGCVNSFGDSPNTNCCPVCVGFPGALPFVNKSAVEKTIKAGLAFGGEINDVAVFERKNYFYPDLAKAYQISQLVRPIVVGGGVSLRTGKRVALNRIHLEEDAGKLVHNEVTGKTMIDYNRGGIPLIEIVTEPDISSAEEAVEFLEEVRSRLVFSGVANCKMEEGGMRCDVNLSLKRKGSRELGARTETKNLNSFKMVARAIEFEARRQAEVLDAGKSIVVETRKWDDAKGKTFSMRNKEESQDYRYFPDPDICAVSICKEEVDKIRGEMPMLGVQYREKFMSKYGLPEYDAEILTRGKEIALFYQGCVDLYMAPKQISNWIMVDLLKTMKDGKHDSIPISAAHFTDIIRMVDEKKINKTVGLQLLEKVIESGKAPTEIASGLGLLDSVSEEDILVLLRRLKQENPKVAEDFKASPEKVLRFIIGYVMKNTKGRAKSEIVEKLIEVEFNK